MAAGSLLEFALADGTFSGRLDRDILDRVQLAVARSIGQKFAYARVDQGVRQHHAKRALELLAAARLCDVVRHSAAHRLPLGGEVKNNFRKVILVDVGWLHALLGEGGGSGRVKTTQGDPVEYRLLSLPFYLVWRLPELLTSFAR